MAAAACLPALHCCLSFGVHGQRGYIFCGFTLGQRESICRAEGGEFVMAAFVQLQGLRKRVLQGAKSVSRQCPRLLPAQCGAARALRLLTPL